MKEIRFKIEVGFIETLGEENFDQFFSEHFLPFLIFRASFGGEIKLN